MNEYLLAVILGVVEGVTEFLPVSSTAHLRIVQAYLGVPLEDEYWKFFAVFIQLGAILAVMVLFRGRLASFAKDAAQPEFYRQPLAKLLSHPISLIGMAFVCTAIPAYLLKNVIGDNLESLTLMAYSLLGGGVVMIAVDYLCRHGRTKSVDAMKPWQAIFVGTMQVLSAVFPGTSRSMSTIAAGQLAGLTRAAALEFSFLVSIPVMIAATFYDFYKYMNDTAGIAFTQTQAIALAIGFVVSFLVAYVVVAWFLSYVRNRGFIPFGIYRIALGAFILLAL